MKKHYEFYERLLLSEKEEQSPSAVNPYWDLIVITSINNEQKKCYERQIESKLKANRLPKRFNYLVISDPEGAKIGSGGATLHLIGKLVDLFKEDFFKMKILLIHAGGYSQRMPTCTSLGKIFSTLAVDSNYVNDILDLKLATFLHFSVRMAPGIFITASDDFNTFEIDEQLKYGAFFGSDGNHFVLLAHKSSLSVGKDHGVYSLDNQVTIGDDDQTSSKERRVAFKCKFVLQKPSIDRMRQLNVVQRENDDCEFVFTDSSFYFSHEISKVFYDLNRKHFDKIQLENIEVDAYRDFLQPLGTEPLSLESYMRSACCCNNTTVSSSTFRQHLFNDIYQSLIGKNSIVLALTNSKFYHLGTLGELFDFYLNALNPEAVQFRNDLCFKRFKTNDNIQSHQQSATAVILFSRFNADLCKFSSLSILEYCFIDEKVKLILNDYCFLSNCQIKLSELPEKLGLSNSSSNSSRESSSSYVYAVPEGVCMHTVPIRCSAEGDKTTRTKYVTIFFGRNDDLKKVYADFNSVVFLNKKLPDDLINHLQSSQNSTATIWHLKIYQAFDTMSESFHKAYESINQYLASSSSSSNSSLLLNESSSSSSFSSSCSSSMMMSTTTQSDLNSSFFDLNSSGECECYSLFDLLKMLNFDAILAFRSENQLLP